MCSFVFPNIVIYISARSVSVLGRWLKKNFDRYNGFTVRLPLVRRHALGSALRWTLSLTADLCFSLDILMDL